MQNISLRAYEVPVEPLKNALLIHADIVVFRKQFK